MTHYFPIRGSSDLHGGAWIETGGAPRLIRDERSPLMQGRGSKLNTPVGRILTGSRPSCRGVDRNAWPTKWPPSSCRRPSCRGVDRNIMENAAMADWKINRLNSSH